VENGRCGGRSPKASEWPFVFNTGPRVPGIVLVVFSLVEKYFLFVISGVGRLVKEIRGVDDVEGWDAASRLAVVCPSSSCSS